MNVEFVFVTFGGGNVVWRARARRLASSARGTGLFDRVVALTDKNLASLVPSFSEDHAELVGRAPRGYGYWLWKPAIISALLDATSRTRIVVYLDAGCDISPTSEAMSRWRDLLKEVVSRGYLFFENEVPDASDLRYTKRDLLDFLAVPSALAQTQQIQSGTVFLANGRAMTDLSKQWYEIGACNDYHFLDDSLSWSAEFEGFVAHRHDQSILSCLAKLGGCQANQNGTAPSGRWTDQDLPILAGRNRGVYATTDTRYRAQAERRLIRALVRIRRREMGV